MFVHFVRIAKILAVYEDYNVRDRMGWLASRSTIAFFNSCSSIWLACRTDFRNGIPETDCAKEHISKETY